MKLKKQKQNWFGVKDKDKNSRRHLLVRCAFLRRFSMCGSKNKTLHAVIQQGILFTVKMLDGGMINCCVLTFFLKNWFYNRSSASLAETLLPNHQLLFSQQFGSFLFFTPRALDKDATCADEELTFDWRCAQLLRGYKGSSIFVFVRARATFWWGWLDDKYLKKYFSSTSQSCLEHFWIDPILIQIPYN